MIFRILTLVMILTMLVLGAGCSQDPHLTSPEGAPGQNPGTGDKNGTETLGPPSIPIAAGTGFAEGGVGMVGVNSAELTVNVPVEAQVVQALLYWAGGSTNDVGDDEISLDGNLIQGELIGGPVHFFGSYDFYAYRADITALGLVAAGTNTFTVADFDFTGSYLDENNGASILVIYDDGTAAALELRDGLDMAYFGFEPTLDATVPQVFSVDPASVDRVADMVIVAASVGENRPNVIKVTTSEGDQLFLSALGSYEGLTWDSVILAVDVPAGVDELSVQLISPVNYEPNGASLGWVSAGLALEAAVVDSFQISGSVFEDTDRDGDFGSIEWGIGDVVVELIDGKGTVTTATSAPDGRYMFHAPAGDYTVNINLADYQENFNADLAMFFDPTTVLSLPVTIGPDSPAHDFGFTPATEVIIADLADGTLTSDGLSEKYWTKVFRRALIEEHSRRRGRGHHGRHGRNHHGWGHGENYFSGEELRAFTEIIEGLYLETPYQFTEGNELRDVFNILKTKVKTEEETLFKELLITELNFAAGRGITGQADVLGVLISWGESLLAAGDGLQEKGRAADISQAITVFKGVNTGGGGGVDE